MYHVQTMYNIKQAAARAGVTVPVLRAWERRYGIVHPGRTAGGYRQFDDAAVARIRAMRALVDDGWSPSAAAAAIVAGAVPADGPDAGGDSGPAPDGGASAGRTLASRDVASTITERFVDAARRLDPSAAVAVLDDLFARGSFERVVLDLLFPALHRLGEAWASGDVSVAGEHMLSSAVQRRLGLMLEAAGSPAANVGNGRRVVVGLPSGGRHELSALAFAVAARRAGMPVTYLGTDLPVGDWVIAAAGAGAAVIGAVIPRDRRAAVAVARRLRVAYPDLVIAIGGRSAPLSTEFLRLGGPLTESVEALQEAIGAVRPSA